MKTLRFHSEVFFFYSSCVLRPVNLQSRQQCLLHRRRRNKQNVSMAHPGKERGGCRGTNEEEMLSFTGMKLDWEMSGENAVNCLFCRSLSASTVGTLAWVRRLLRRLLEDGEGRGQAIIPLVECCTQTRSLNHSVYYSTVGNSWEFLFTTICTCTHTHWRLCQFTAVMVSLQIQSRVCP